MAIPSHATRKKTRSDVGVDGRIDGVDTQANGEGVESVPTKTRVSKGFTRGTGGQQYSMSMIVFCLLLIVSCLAGGCYFLGAHLGVCSSILGSPLNPTPHRSSQLTQAPTRNRTPTPAPTHDLTGGTYYLLQEFASDVFVAADEDRKDRMYDTELEKVQAENIDLKNQLLRSLAEQENIRSIARIDVNAAKDYAIQSFAQSLLEVSDNLDRALKSVSNEMETTTDPSSDTFQSFIKGIELTNSGLTKAFKSVGVEAMDVGTENDGEELVFNPEQHQALMEYADPTKTPGTIDVVMKKGYTLNGRVLRPAEVGVIKK